MESKRVETQVGGRTLSIETGKIAKQASGAVMVQYGDTVVFVAAVNGPARPGTDYFPLCVDYREKTYAAGKFPGGFFKREGRPTNKEILTCRLVDRPIRPLFPKSFMDELIISAIVMSADGENEPDILSMVGASAALMLAPKIPFMGPVSAVRVGMVGDELILNPTKEQLEESVMDLVVSGSEEAVTMIEGDGKELAEEDMVKAISFAQEAIKDLCRIQRELADLCGVTATEAPATEECPLVAELESKYFDRVMEAHQVIGKFERYDALKAVTDLAVEDLATEDGPEAGAISDAMHELERKACRDLILKENKREDGRALDEVRPISCEVGLLPTTHGSALFTRGETQALVTCTLGTSRDQQRVEGLEDESTQRFMLHYNFPSFCVGEARMPRGPSRRDIGHGTLAERSLTPVLPDVEEFPYTLRIVSEIMESNGSSSQASVCGGTLAMMDAGVPIQQPVAGVAMGLVSDGDTMRILTDICGSEDHHGDMDLKIAGTQNGITSVQMDLKISGVKEDMLMEAFTKARDARIHVLKQMLTAIAQPREKISELAPRLLLVKIAESKIGMVIGPGGKMIKKIQEETGAKIDIEDDGSVHISCVDAAGAEQARDMVLGITEDPELNRIYKGKVSGIKDFGAFVEILPGKDGLAHISELSEGYVKTVDDVCKLGDELLVKVIAIDAGSGKIRLSRKAALRDRSGERDGASGPAAFKAPEKKDEEKKS